MKRKSLLILSIALMCTLVLASCTPSEYRKLSKELDDFLTNDPSAFSGSVLIALDGKIILKKGYGMADYEKRIPNTPGTELKIASVTKPFTATAIMMLEERGLLSINDPVSKYISDFKLGEKITIHHLISMTSGISDNIMDDWNDCNRYCYDYKGDQLKNKAEGYIRIGNNKKTDQPVASGLNMSYVYAAGGLYSTVEDLYKWDQALYTEKIVNKETLKKMFTPNLGNYGYGWKIYSNDKDFVGHSGNIKGFRAIFYRFLRDKATVIILTNENDLEGINKPASGLFKIMDRYGVLSINTSTDW